MELSIQVSHLEILTGAKQKIPSPSQQLNNSNKQDGAVRKHQLWFQLIFLGGNQIC